MVRFNCPGCRVVLKAPDRHIGAAMPCPKCGHRLFVPGPLPAGGPTPAGPRSRLPLLLGGAAALTLVAGLVVALVLIVRPPHRGGDAVVSQTSANLLTNNSPAPADGGPRPPTPASADQPPSNGTRSAGGGQPPSDGPAEELEEGRRYALVVGVQDYKGTALGSLRYCDNDAAGLAEVLGQRGYRVTLMTRPEYKARDRDDLLPTADNIRDNLQALLRNRKPADTVLVAFAGHGEQLKKDGKMYFLPAKCDLDRPETLIGLDEVYALLKDNPAGGKALIVDACRNDPLAGRGGGSEKLESVTRPELPEPPGGTVALFSCSKDQVAYESDALKHGFLFHFVIEGLEGKAANKKDGRITWLGLAKHVDDELPDAVVGEHGPKAVQTPEARGEVRGLVLARMDAGAGPTQPPQSEDKPKPPVTKEEKPVTKEDKPEEEITNTIGMKVKLIKAGTFLMGSPKDEEGRDVNEGPQHTAPIPRAFYMGVYPVTCGQFAAFVQDAGYQTEAEKTGAGAIGFNALTGQWVPNPEYTWRRPGFSQGEDHPVVNVSWNDAQAFCAWLGRKEGMVYKLPTEAEWEYACRAGTTTRFWCGDTDASLEGKVNIADATLKGMLAPDAGKDWTFAPWDDGYAFTSPVGHFQANPWGLYDMVGNVKQWCADGYPLYTDGRVLRGSSWVDGPRLCRSAQRDGHGATVRGVNVGFRVAALASAKTR